MFRLNFVNSVCISSRETIYEKFNANYRFYRTSIMPLSLYDTMLDYIEMPCTENESSRNVHTFIGCIVIREERISEMRMFVLCGKWRSLIEENMRGNRL